MPVSVSNFVISTIKKWWAKTIRATRCTKAPAYAGSKKGSHHLVNCTQPYPVFYTRDCFQDLNLWPFSHITATLPVAPRLPIRLKLLNKNFKNWGMRDVASMPTLYYKAFEQKDNIYIYIYDKRVKHKWHTLMLQT